MERACQISGFLKKNDILHIIVEDNGVGYEKHGEDMDSGDMEGTERYFAYSYRTGKYETSAKDFVPRQILYEDYRRKKCRNKGRNHSACRKGKRICGK